MTFNRDLSPASVEPSDLTVRRLPGGVPFNATAVTYDPATRTATFTLAAAPLADGNYQATLAQGSVTDTQGSPLADMRVADFFVLAGDANRDRKVDFADLVVLAQNYNTTGKNFAQANFSYDPAGNVDFEDLVILAQRYNTKLDPPAAATAAIAASAPAASQDLAASRRRAAQHVFNTTVPIKRPKPKALAPRRT
jgi:hypothetical protein